MCFAADDYKIQYIMTGFTLSKLTFNDGTTIDLADQDIVVFVGPNNMGKSQSLRDIYNSISSDRGNIVVTDVGLTFHNSPDIKGVIEKHSLSQLFGQYIGYIGYHYQIHSASIDGFGKSRYVDENIKKFLVSMVETEERLTTSSPKQMQNPGEAKTCPLQYITDSKNRQVMSDIFEKIFAKKIYCEDRGSTKLVLHMGEEIDFEKSDLTSQQIVDEHYKRMSTLPKVHEQGDGIRSLAGLLLNMMMPNYTMFLIDEPEAFMHPPQARVLGENLPKLLGDRQAYISTHSIDFIKGLLTSAVQRVKIIRLMREGDLNSVHCLPPSELNAIWTDPIMRHSNILDGLFYPHTVLCESDSDCQLYAAMLSHIKEEQKSFSDTLFTLCNGKGRMKPLSKTFKSLGIDYRIVPDLDFFNDEGLVKAVFENCGGIWTSAEADYRILYNAMNLPSGTMTIDSFVDEVRKTIDEKGWGEITKPYVKKLCKDLPTLLESQWDKLKHNGLDYIQDPVVRSAADRLINALNSVGIFPVKIGELESFFSDVSSHGPGYAIAVLEKHPDLNAPEYKKLRECVTSWGI